MPETCPIHGAEFRTESEQYGPGCRKKVGTESPYGNKNGYCRWRPGAKGFEVQRAGNGASNSTTRSSYGKTPEERRSIEAQCSMKCATELFAPLLASPEIRNISAETRATLVTEMIGTAYKINDGIRWMAGAKREEIRDAVQGPPPREPGEDDSEYEYTDEEAARLATRYGQR